MLYNAIPYNEIAHPRHSKMPLIGRNERNKDTVANNIKTFPLILPLSLSKITKRQYNYSIKTSQSQQWKGKLN